MKTLNHTLLLIPLLWALSCNSVETGEERQKSFDRTTSTKHVVDTGSL